MNSIARPREPMSQPPLGRVQPLLEVRDLNIYFRTAVGDLQAARDVSFSIMPGEAVGLVGESGSGKTITGLSILGLLPRRQCRVTGQILFEGRDLLAMGERGLRRIRGNRIGMIFQEPMSALDPVFTVGAQISETLLAHRPVGRKEARERGIEALAAVGIPSPARRYDEYPHQLSGGMRQRVMIAMTLICEPRLLIADEPTTALDVTVQAQIIDLLHELSQRTSTALLFITHDLGVVAETCSRMLTMYAGEVVEDAATDDVLSKPRHPYTSGLLRSIPRLSPRKSALPSIGGRVPPPTDMPAGCRFGPRCSFAMAQCQEYQPMLSAGDRRVRCVRHEDLDLEGGIA